jgi:hypothetical protein
MKYRTLFIALLVATPLLGQAHTPEQEIQLLLQKISQSGCDFVRNGDRHPAAEAAEHLAMKYQRAGGRIKTAEAFIDHIASKSSFSGKPYQVICPQQPAVNSGPWLRQQLLTLRQP